MAAATSELQHSAGDLGAKAGPATIAVALEELELKYTSTPADLDTCIQFLSSSPPKGQCLRRLKRIILSENEISALGDVKQVAETLKNAREVDLSHNAFESWRIVGEMLHAVPMLRQLDLSFNPLKGPVEAAWIPSNNHLEALMLNGVGPSMDELQALFKSLPHLRQLEVCGASLEAQQKPSCSSADKENRESLQPLHEELTDLYMDGCQLGSWSQCLQYARRFPALQSLRLCENKFTQITAQCPESGVHIREALPNLRSLALNQCGIREWSSIEALAELTNLVDLRIRDVPLFDQYDCDTKHQLIIPRLPSLETLNGSAISTRYREDCERFFIRFYQGHDEKPRVYESLIAVHGRLEPLVCVDFTPKEFVKMRVRCDERNLNHLLRFRLHITVNQLLRSLSKFTGIPLKQLRVMHVPTAFPERGPSELRSSVRYLHGFHIDDMDELHVFTKSVPGGASRLC
ncbi:Coel-1 [Aphelenchoides fujianensis]|nr:Coel-1 [Aphelenchoides fujianensis]